MTFELRLTSRMHRDMLQDLHRPHGFARERVGFLFVGAARLDRRTLLLARAYEPVADEHYIDDQRYGALINKKAFSMAFERAHRTRSGMFHVHAHGGKGPPRFSKLDTVESDKFCPTFFGTCQPLLHGAIVLSGTHAAVRLWTAPDAAPVTRIDVRLTGGPLSGLGDLHAVA